MFLKGLISAVSLIGAVQLAQSPSKLSQVLQRTDMLI
jgi:hypothetical protein